MQSNSFVKLFDVLDSGFRDWGFSAFGLIFVVIGLVVFFLPRIIKATGIAYLDFPSRRQKFFRYFFLGFALLWTGVTFFSTYADYQRHRALVQTNTCTLAEGPVTNFVPMPYGGHADESFSIGSVRFKYSDYEATDAFNNTASHGGPITKDAYLRICYDPRGNKILRLEIRGYKGQIKDYSRGSDIFSVNPEARSISPTRASVHLPWYGHLFLILYALDFIATLNLLLPYLRTFVRLNSTPLADLAIPTTLAGEVKIKLRNTILCWDKTTHAIWLRPRGFNLFQVQLVAAKLNTDESGTLITSKEIRFSSGFIVVMMLFFGTAYQMLSMNSTIPKDMPALFLGAGALLFIISGAANLKRLRMRMDALVQDALEEFKTM